MLELRSLKIFQQVTISGSFSAAATQLFMTPPAVLHRMNELEKELGVTLFNRTAHGVTLTKPGQTLIEHAQELLDRSDQITKLVRKSALETRYTVRIGSSTINPANELHELWDKISQKLPQYRLQFIPLENNDFSFPETYQNMGQRVDVLFTPYGMESVKNQISFYEVGRYNFCVMMHPDDPLAQKQVISLTDLIGANFSMMPLGMTKEIDDIYQDIQRDQLNINITQTDAHYTVDTFNKFTESGQYLLSLDCWKNVLPGLISRPLDVPYSLPFGFITDREPPQSIKLFMSVLKSLSK